MLLCGLFVMAIVAGALQCSNVTVNPASMKVGLVEIMSRCHLNCGIITLLDDEVSDVEKLYCVTS